MELKRTINAFAKHGGSMATLYTPLAAVRLNLQLQLTPVTMNRQMSSSGEALEQETETESSDLTSDTEYVFQLQELLYSEAVCSAAKLQLLLLLQENSQVLVKSERGLAQLLSFLFELVRSPQQLPLLSGQAMVCCCSLMIGRDLLRDEHQLCSKFVSHLLELVGSVNSIHNMLLRLRSIQCLLALEDAYPCLLAKKLEYFYQFCANEKTYLSEFYYSLFALLLVHVFQACVKELGSWSDDRLTSRVESLPAMSLSLMLPVRGRQSLAPSAPQQQPKSPTPGSGPQPELLRALNLLVAALDSGRLSPRAFASVCRSTAPVLAAHQSGVGGVSGGRMLRTAFYRRLASWDPSVLSALAGLRLRFGLEELGGSDAANGDSLALSMQRMACSPLFPTPLRLLMCHFLAAYPHLRVCSGRDAFPRRASHQLVKSLFPTVFDPIDLRVLKVNLLSLRFAPRDSSDEASACLMGTLVSLSRPALKSRGRGRPASAFFASLYAVFSRHQASVLGEDIRQMLISMVNANLAFADHLLDFLDCVTQDFPDSELPFLAYSELCDWVAINSLENAADRDALSRYMTILNRAALYSRIPARPIIEFLTELGPARLSAEAATAAASSDESSDDWLCGHLVLDVCRSLFRTHAVQLDSDPGLLAALCGVIADFADAATVDVDVRSRAQLYYSLACHMAPTKVAAVVFDGLEQSQQLQQQPRTRTSIAVATPPASQTMPEVRVLSVSPIDLVIAGPASEEGDALVFPLQLTCRRTGDLPDDETALLAVDLTFEAFADPEDEELDASPGPVAVVEPIHVPRLELPPPRSSAASTVQLHLRLCVAFRRPLPCLLSPRLECTAATACRPLAARLPLLRLGIADLLQPSPCAEGEEMDEPGWCALDQPCASFIRVPAAFAALKTGSQLIQKLVGTSGSSQSRLAFRVAPNCQLRLAMPAVAATSGPTGGGSGSSDLLLAFCCCCCPSVPQEAHESCFPRDSRRLLLHFDRYLKAAFNASELNAVQL